MTPENIITPEAEFVMRRTQESLPAWALFLPVAFAFLVLLLITLFRREHRWRGLLWSSLVVGMLSAFYLPSRGTSSWPRSSSSG
jgi:hypothetical protein